MVQTTLSDNSRQEVILVEFEENSGDLQLRPLLFTDQPTEAELTTWEGDESVHDSEL